MLMAKNVSESVEAIGLGLLQKVLGWSKEDADNLAAKVQVQIGDPKSHIYAPIGVFYGRKPENPD